MACEICTGASDRVKGSKRIPEDQRKKNMGLLAAAFVGHTECLTEFIKAGANVNCTDGSFDQECQNNLSLKAKCSFEDDHYNRTSWTPLIYAVRRGDQEITKLLLRAGAHVNYAEESETALVCAVEKCDHNLVVILVKQGADVNITNKNPKVEPPIVRAVAAGSTECFEMLLNSGADVNISYSSICGNTTPILKSVECGIPKCLYMLVEAGADVNLQAGGRAPIHEVTIKGNIECLNILIEAGADVNLQTRGRAPIHEAAINGNIECLNILIEAGADVNLQAGGRAPIHEATIKGNIECLNILIEAGADVNLQAKERATIHEATINGNIECLNILIEAEADVNIRDKSGKTPVFTAVSYEKHECTKLLIRLGADVNIPDKYGSTPLTAAVKIWYFLHRRCDSAFYRIIALLKAGADVKSVTNTVRKFRSALFSATQYEGVKFVRLLLNHGAQINHANEWENAFGGIFCGSAYYTDGTLEIQKFLQAAGEKLDRLIFKPRNSQNGIPKYFIQLKENLDLKHLCREAIRKHLIDLDPHEHLFGRIPQLELPSILNDYLLYDCSLDSSQDRF